MASGYPNSLDSWPTTHQDNVNEAIHAGDINNLADAINQIEAELGITPSGTLYTTVAARLNRIELLNIRTISTTTYTLALTDQSQALSLANASAITLTIPTNATVAFPFGTVIQIRQALAGQITVSPAAGVTLVSRGSVFRTAGQYAWATLIKTNTTDNWDLTGDIA